MPVFLSALNPCPRKNPQPYILLLSKKTLLIMFHFPLCFFASLLLSIGRTPICGKKHSQILTEKPKCQKKAQCLFKSQQ